MTLLGLALTAASSRYLPHWFLLLQLMRDVTSGSQGRQNQYLELVGELDSLIIGL